MMMINISLMAQKKKPGLLFINRQSVTTKMNFVNTFDPCVALHCKIKAASAKSVCKPRHTIHLTILITLPDDSDIHIILT